ncbi:MAG: hypothetical protein KZQ96_21380 [Candidatus Thiodiazotropha sp. (ex Lucinoma borealis)]|nr:hypothetical protein [Candidatus Thiodiazotropha sp. (ex Lucinoma borealis)]MCU7869643.1 hypothetical protein [Candidatus Thiodiazotropha sp. (ex Lucinoma borealis)]
MIVRDSSAKTTQLGWSPNPGGGYLCVCVLIAGLVAGVPLAVADEDGGFTNNMDEVAPLRNLLEHVHEAYPGQVLEVELEREEYGKEDIWVYEIKLLTKKGSVLKLEYDAIDLELLKIKGKPEN